jgi:hypothetical protein
MNRLFVIVLMLSAFSASRAAVAAPDQYSSFYCHQLCGLTETATSSVSFSSLSESDARSALSDLCGNQDLKLQGEAKCSESRFDFSKNERFQRCKSGISPLGTCFVSVHGFGDRDRYFQTFQAFSNDSFDDAESKAIEKCRKAVGHCSRYTCSVAAYTAY